LQVGELKRTDIFNKPQLRRLFRCSQIKSVATDFHSIAFVPLRLDRYMLRNALKADTVVVRRGKYDKHEPFYIAPAKLRANLLNEGKYQQAFMLDDYDVFVATKISRAF
jgi:hypothetical protein